jgi:hypothetical protein
MKSLKVLGAVLFFCGLVVTGCGKSDSLVGKWVGSSGRFEFAKDHTGIMVPAQPGPGIPASVPFKWSAEGANEVRILLPNAGKQTVIGKLDQNHVLVIEDDKFVKQ